jgi:hypothetical protein
LRKYT